MMCATTLASALVYCRVAHSGCACVMMLWQASLILWEFLILDEGFGEGFLLAGVLEGSSKLTTVFFCGFSGSGFQSADLGGDVPLSMEIKFSSVFTFCLLEEYNDPVVGL